MIAENLNQVRENIRKACIRAGRDPEEVTLIAVSKTKPAEILMEAYEAGARCFGENKVQEIQAKYGAMPADVKWHMIGHLQRNKVKYIMDKVCMIHSVDSVRLASTIDQEAEKAGIVMPVLIEVNVAQEETKYGVAPDQVLPLIMDIHGFSHISVQGLMTIAPYVEDPEENRQIFSVLKKLSVDIRDKNVNNINMDILSMGMTGDYTVAVEEGATMVRVGTGIFGERNYDKL